MKEDELCRMLSIPDTYVIVEYVETQYHTLYYDVIVIVKPREVYRVCVCKKKSMSCIDLYKNMKYHSNLPQKNTL